MALDQARSISVEKPSKQVLSCTPLEFRNQVRQPRDEAQAQKTQRPEEVDPRLATQQSSDQAQSYSTVVLSLHNKYRYVWRDTSDPIEIKFRLVLILLSPSAYWRFDMI